MTQPLVASDANKFIMNIEYEIKALQNPWNAVWLSSTWHHELDDSNVEGTGDFEIQRGSER
jgi:hypothetical protein